MNERASVPGWARPIRIPAEVEITHTDPPFAVCGEISTWRALFRFSRPVPPGAELRLQVSGGRNNKPAFDLLQTQSPEQTGYVSAARADGTALAITACKDRATFAVAVPEQGFARGDEIVVTLGAREMGGPGTRVSAPRILNKFMVLYSPPGGGAESVPPQWAGGKGWGWGDRDRIVAACTMHVLGGPIDHVRAYVRPRCKPGEPLDILVRPEDRNDLLAHQAPSAIEVRLGEEVLPATLTPVPGSTCLCASVVPVREGIHRFSVRLAGSAIEASTNPSVCAKEPERRLPYWGMIHGHTEISDGTGTLDQYFHQLRYETALDFGAPADHDHLWETPDELWQAACDAVKRWNAPGSFTAFLGYEWAKWRKNGDGDRNVYYAEDDRPLYRSDDGEYPSPPDLFRALREHGETAMVIPHHPGHGGNFCDWKDHSPEHERLVEIFQVRGSYECPAEDGNPAPERDSRTAPFLGGYVSRALALGWRVGFTAGGDDHDGQWGTEYRFEKHGYKQGLMCVLAGDCTRKALFEGMRARRVVATTGARILLDYTFAGRPLGSELSVSQEPELAELRPISIAFHGTAPLDRVDIIRNNAIVHSIPGQGRLDLHAEWEDAAPIDGTFLPPARHCDHPFTFYYVRAIQTDGEIAWASPVWIDP